MLASQGIECGISTAEEDGSASLEVARKDLSPAEAVLQQYQEEVRARSLPPGPSVRPAVVFDWSALGWPLLVAAAYWGQTSQPGMQEAGVMDRDAVLSGEWWRPLSAVLLHADLAHAAANAVFGFVFLGLAMARFGLAWLLLVGCLSGIAGNVWNCLTRAEQFVSLGSSGMVMSWLGVLVGSGLSPRNAAGYPRLIWLRAVLAGAMLFVLLGVSPGSDVVAHLVGFVCGVLAGFLLVPADQSD